MDTPAEYLEKTASAAQKLFEGIDSYLEIIRGHEKSLFVSGALTPEEMQADFEAWQSDNQEAIQQWKAASERYFSETFAQATLCGAVLQIAFKAISATRPTKQYRKSGPRRCLATRSRRSSPLVGWCAGFRLVLSSSLAAISTCTMKTARS